MAKRRPNQPKPPATREERQAIVEELSEWIIKRACEQHPDLNLFVTYDMQPNHWRNDDVETTPERGWTIRIYEDPPTRFSMLLNWEPCGFACRISKILEKLAPLPKRKIVHVAWWGDAGWQSDFEETQHISISGRYRGVFVLVQVYAMPPSDVWSEDDLADFVAEMAEEDEPEPTPVTEPEPAPVPLQRRALRLRPSAVVSPPLDK